MHYCCYLYTKEFPTDDVITRVMEPFKSYSDYEERPPILWDWMMLGGRYAGKLKLAVTKSTIEKYEFDVCAKTKRAGRLFRCRLHELTARGILDNFGYRLNTIDEEEAIRYCGYRDGVLYVDGAWIQDLTNFDEIADACYCAVDSDGNAIARDTYNGHEWIRDEDFDQKLRDLANRSRNDCYLTVLDLHN